MARGTYAALVGAGVALAAIFLPAAIFEPFLAVFLDDILVPAILVPDIFMSLILEAGAGVALAAAFFFLVDFLAPVILELVILVLVILVLAILVSAILATGAGVGSALAAKTRAMVAMPVHSREVNFIVFNLLGFLRPGATLIGSKRTHERTYTLLINEYHLHCHAPARHLLVFFAECTN